MEAESDLSWIAIDYGNVINGYDYDRFVTFLANGQTGDFERVEESLLGGRGLLAQYEIGALSTDAFLDAVQRDLSPSRRPGEIRSAFTGIFTDWPEARATVKSLASCFKLAVISDTNELHFDAIVKPAVGAYVSQFIASHLVGYKKPDLRIYRTFLRQAGTDPEHCLYFDDRKENVEAARDAGIPGRVVSGPSGLRDACTELGLI